MMNLKKRQSLYLAAMNSGLPQEASWHVYGESCGRGYTDPSLTSRDAFDAACLEHDLAYDDDEVGANLAFANSLLHMTIPYVTAALPYAASALLTTMKTRQVMLLPQ